MNQFIWKYKEYNQNEITHISKEFSVPNSIATIMSLKSINDKIKSRNFFYTNFDSMHDPFLMLDMDKAVHRLSKARDEKELILIIGDYDADGTTATSILY